METPYDWITVSLFAGLVVLFLQRSQGEARDQLWHYMVAAGGIAGTDIIGNEALKAGETLYHVGAIALGIATLGFIWFILRPFGGEPS